MRRAIKKQGEGEDEDAGAGVGADTDTDREGVRWTVTRLLASQSPIAPKSRVPRAIKRQRQP